MKDLSAARRALLVTAFLAVSLGSVAPGQAASGSEPKPASEAASEAPAASDPSMTGKIALGTDEHPAVQPISTEASPGADESDDATEIAPASRGGPSEALRKLIRKHAEAHGVPVELAEAVVHVESRFNPRARGRAGEIGLMQIKPATARLIGYRGTKDQLYDPETNLTWGMRYLAKAYELANGDTCGAILRYNGGHAARKMTRHVRAYCGKVNRYVAAL